MSFLIVRNDLSVVEAEFIRPRTWIKSLGLVKGARLDLAVPELGIDGLAEVTAVRDCPPIAEGEGRVATGKFVTRDVANVVKITLANGTEIWATDVHPVWSIDREDWVQAGRLEPCEQVDTLAGPVAVASVERLDRHPAVYNLEVHGEHVYRIAVDGVLVHNAGPGCPTVVYAYPKVGDKVYFGITSDESRRAAQHALDPMKYGGMGTLTDRLPRGIAETLEAMLIRYRLADAKERGIISGFDSVREQLTKAGLLNRNRGRDPSRWVDVDFTKYFPQLQ